jgi:hypothetical protein
LSANQPRIQQPWRACDMQIAHTHSANARQTARLTARNERQHLECRQTRITHHISRLLPSRLYYGSFHRSSCHNQGMHLPASDSRLSTTAVSAVRPHITTPCSIVLYSAFSCAFPTATSACTSVPVAPSQSNRTANKASALYLIAKSGTNVLTTVGRHSGQQRLSSHMLKQSRATHHH